MEYTLFIVLNVLSYAVFKGLVKPAKADSVRLIRIGLGVGGAWLVLRILNYGFLVSLNGRYTDEWVVLALVFCMDFLFVSKLTKTNRAVRYIKNIRRWYTVFNIARIILFMLSWVIYPTRLLAYPLTNLDKTKDYHLIGPYWGNKQQLREVWTFLVGQRDIVGTQDIVSVVKKGLLFRRVVFQRKYNVSYRYFASSDPKTQVVLLGQDSVQDDDACFYLYRKAGTYYLTYLGDGESCPGDQMVIGGQNGGPPVTRILGRSYLDSSNRAKGLPVGVQDYPLN